jgi:hypothetical protein
MMNNVKAEALLLVGSVGAVGLPPSVIKIKSTGPALIRQYLCCAQIAATPLKDGVLSR